MKEQGKAIEVFWFDAGQSRAVGQAELGIAYQEHELRFVSRVLS